MLAGVREGEIPTAPDIAFGVAPRINAAGRMAHPKLALKALCSPTDIEAETNVATLDTLNKRRKQQEREILPKIFGQMVAKTGGLVFYGSCWPRGIAGILAARAAGHFHRPAIVLVRDLQTGELTGSGRSIEGVDLHKAVSQCAHLLNRFGGHSQAVGLSLKEPSLDVFREAFRNITAQCGKDPKRVPVAETDLNLSCVSPRFWQDCRLPEPFGIGFPPLMFRYAMRGSMSSAPGMHD
jgi:single-stranded-DNA-specific exonuclease